MFHFIKGVGEDFSLHVCALSEVSTFTLISYLYFQQDAYKAVGYIVSKLSDGNIQIILTDTDGVKSSQAGNDMVNDLTAGINISELR